MSIILIVICLIVGLLIGAIGIGGVLLVPALTYLTGISVYEAIPACMLSFLATGIVGAAVYSRQGSMRWNMALWICLGAVPAAYLGATSLLHIPATVVKLLIAGLMVFAGIDALRSERKVSPEESEIGRLALVGIGLITGYGSAITGTGGPLILVPLAIYIGLPVLVAVGLSQAIQIPIATFASIGNWTQDNLNFTLGLTIAAAMVIGTLAGAMLVHRVPTKPIKKFVAVFLIVAGAGIAVQVLMQPPGG